jgi:cytochrome P450
LSSKWRAAQGRNCKADTKQRKAAPRAAPAPADHHVIEVDLVAHRLNCRSSLFTGQHELLTTSCSTSQRTILTAQDSLLPSFPFESGPYGTTTLAYDVFRTSTPVSRVLVPSGLEVWLVTRYSDVCTVLKDPIFSREEAVRIGASLVKTGGIELEKGVIQNTDGEKHSRLRGVFARHYGHAQVSRWVEIIQREAQASVDRLRPGVVFDLRADFFEPAARQSAEKIFGFTASKGPEILEVSFDERKKAELRDQLLALLENDSSNSEGSYFAMLNSAKDNNLISQPDLLMNLIVLMIVTFEAIGVPFLGGVFALLRDSVQWDKCCRDRSLLPNAIDEILRCHPIGDGQFLRIATGDVLLSGVKIRRGDAVLASTAAANADPSVFVNPRHFDIGRSNSNEHIAFGIGRHHCLGSLLVKVWMRTALTTLLDCLPSLRLAVPPAAVAYRPTPLMNIMDRLPVIF